MQTSLPALAPNGLTQALQPHRDFWDISKAGAPLIEVAYAPPDVYHTPPIRGVRFPTSGQPIRPDMLDPEQYWAHFESSALPVQGNLVQVAAPLGIPWMAAMVGCPLYCKRSDGDLWFMGDIWAEPVARSSQELLDKVSFSPDNEWLQALLAFYRFMVGKVANKYELTTTLLRGPSDMLGQLLGDERMAMELIDHPEETRQALHLLTDIWIQVHKAVIPLIPELARGTVNSWGIWAPGVTVRAQEDHAMILSPRMYKRFIGPCNEQMGAAFDYLLVHRHSGPMIQTLGRLEALLEMENVRGVQVTRDINSPPLERLIEIYGLIQQEKPVLIWGGFTRDEIQRILDSLEHRGLCIKARAESWTEYHRVIQWLEQKGYAGFGSA